MILLIIIAVVILVGFLLLGSEKSKHNNCILCSELTELDEKYCFYCQAKLNLNDTITYSDLRGHLKKNIQLLVRYYPKYLEIAKKFGIQDEATKQYNEASYNLKLEKYSKYRRIQVEEVEEECDDFLYESGRKIGKEVIRNLKKEKRELIESINIELDLLNIEIIKNISVLKNKRNILSYSNEYGVIQKSKWENEIIKYINMVKPGLILKYEKQNMRIRQIDREIEAVKMHKSNLENDFVNTKLIKSNEVDIRKLIEWFNEVLEKNGQEIQPEDKSIRTGKDFEEYCAIKFKTNGWDVVMTPTTGDQGVDLIVTKNDIKFGVQCKYYSKPVGNAAIQEVFAGKQYYQTDEVCVIASAGYTPAAYKLAKSNNVFLFSNDTFLKEMDTIIQSGT